ncbi:MAG: response regulator [Planctomycetes bacterium]|nr:response regulator [Planctomycetota bacterium]
MTDTRIPEATMEFEATIVVVDRDHAGYEALAPLCAGEEASLRFLSTGREALRLAAADRVALWLIGVVLPDMSGFDLQQMLRDGSQEAAACMVAAAYRSEDEIRSHRAGATMYVCKPLQAIWLRPCIRGARARVESLHRNEAAPVPRLIT